MRWPPPCATFLLVAHPALAPRLVEVFRQLRPVAYCQQVAAEAQAETQQCREELRQVRAGQGVPDGLRGALASDLVDENSGIVVRDITKAVIEPEGNALVKDRVSSYRGKGRVAVEAWLVNPGPEPWKAAGAVLRGAKGEVLKPLPLWPPDPIAPGSDRRGRVVVEVLATEGEARGTYTLTLWDADRKRTVTLGNVSFP